MQGILEGLRVLDMGHFVAVPSAGALFADWGADVLKIEPLDGDAQRGDVSLILKRTGSAVNWRFEIHNRNKKSITLNLKKRAGQDILYRLVERSDVFMTNYEQKTTEKLKADYTHLKQYNPGLIYALLSGYGRTGPEKDDRGFDFTAAWARTGIQYLLGEPEGTPPMAPNGMMDRVTGAHMVAGILAALLHREKTGEGQELAFSLYHSGVWSLAADLQVTMAGIEVGQRDRTKVLNPLSNNYRTKDGHWIQLAMLQADLSWTDFCRVIERQDLEKDPRFDNLENRAEHSPELIRILDDIFESRDRTEWESRLRENNCIFGRVASPEMVIRDPQAAANGFFAELEHPEAGKTKYVTTPATFRQNPASVRNAAPELGQHTEEILLELGHTWDEITTLKDEEVIL